MTTAYLDSVKDFLVTHVSHQANDYDNAGVIPEDLLARGREIGLFSQIPLTPEEFWRSHELTGYFCSSLRSLQTVNNMGQLALSKFGSRNLRQYFTEIYPDNTAPLIAFALTESHAGSQATNIQLSATAEGDDYFLTGEKVWVTGATYADWILVFATTNTHKHSAFLVAKDSPGLTLSPIERPYSTRAAGATSLVLEQCKVPSMFRLGREGAGLDWVAATCLDLGRYSVAAGALGVAKAAQDICLDHLSHHPKDTTPLSSEPQVQTIVADLVTDIQATRALAESVIVKRTQQTADATSMTTLLKYKAARVANASTYQAMQLVGQRAFRGGSTLERLHRDAQCLPLIEGTANSNAATIAKAAFRGAFER